MNTSSFRYQRLCTTPRIAAAASAVLTIGLCLEYQIRHWRPDWWAYAYILSVPGLVVTPVMVAALARQLMRWRFALMTPVLALVGFLLSSLGYGEGPDSFVGLWAALLFSYTMLSRRIRESEGARASSAASGWLLGIAALLVVFRVAEFVGPMVLLAFGASVGFGALAAALAAQSRTSSSTQRRDTSATVLPVGATGVSAPRIDLVEPFVSGLACAGIVAAILVARIFHYLLTGQYR